MQLQPTGSGTGTQQIAVTKRAMPTEQASMHSTQPGQRPSASPMEGEDIASASTNPLASSVDGNKRNADRAAQVKPRLNRLASASEQQHGKSGLLGRIMATGSTTGKVVYG